MSTASAAPDPVTVSGSSYHCGLRYAQQAAGKVRAAVAAYRRLVRARAGLSWPDAVDWARRYDPVVADLAPASLAELHGIADGAQLDYPEVLALNCRSELLFATGTLAAGATECSSLAVQPEASAGGEVWGAQNWDWNPTLAPSVVVCAAQPDDEPGYVMVGEAGHLAKVGLNSAGLAVCTNTLVSLTDGVDTGLPYHLVLRELLRCGSVSHAVALLRAVPLAMSANYLLVDVGGAAYDVETVGGATPTVEVLEPDHGMLAHTNHYLAPRLVAGDAMISRQQHSPGRLRALREGLAAQAPEVDLGGIQALLRNHVGFPDSVCSHPRDAQPVEERRATLASVVMNPSRSTVWIAEGPPCTTPYKQYEVQSTAAAELTGAGGV